MEVDEALSRLGKYSKWQMFTYTLVCLSVTVSGCWHMMVIVFTGGEPGHHCKVPEGQLVNETIPLVVNVKRQKVLSQCEKYVNYTVDNSTMPCDEGWYYEPDYHSTLVTEWDLVCDNNYLVETSQSVFVFGVMVGAIFFTTLADHIGRKPVHLGCQWAMIGVGLVIAFSPNYVTFVIMRFILGAIREGAGLTGIVMACEIFPASQRTFAGTALELYWAASWMLLALLAYFIRDWRSLQLTVTIPPILTVALIWLVPESVPWLAANGREEEAEVILRQAAKMNNIHFPDQILIREEDELDARQGAPDEKQKDFNTPNDADHNNSIPRDQSSEQLKGRLRNILRCFRKEKKIVTDENIEKDNNVKCLDMLRSRKMCLYAFVMCSLWFASGIVYYGLSLSTSTLAGDRYINFFLSGAVEAPAYLMTVFVLQKWGRRWPLCIFHIIAGVVLFINIFIPEQTESGMDLTAVIITLIMIGKFSMTAAFGTVVLYAPEIYPTNLRNLGFGLASVAGRLAAMLAPFTSYIGKIVPWIPGVVFSVVSISTGLMALLLPETLNRPLPDTIEDIENWNRPGNKRHRQSVDGKVGDGDGAALVIRHTNSPPSKDETAV